MTERETLHGTLGEKFGYFVGCLLDETANTLNVDYRVIHENLIALRTNYRDSLYLTALEVLAYVNKRVKAKEIVLSNAQRENLEKVLTIKY